MTYAPGSPRRMFAVVIALSLPGVLAAQPAAWRTVAFSPDSRLVAAGAGMPGEAGDLVVWDIATRKPHWAQRQPSGVASVAFSSDGKVLAVGTFSADCKLLDLATGKVRRILDGHGKAARSVAFAPDGAMLAVGSYDQGILLWDWADGKLKHTFSGHTDLVYQVVWSRDGRLLASASADKTARLWDVKTLQPHQTLTQFQSIVRTLVFGPQDRWLAVGSWNLPNRVFDPATGTLQRSFGGIHGDALALAPDGVTLAVCGLHHRSVDIFTLDFRDPTDTERTRIEALIAQLDDDAPARRDEAGQALLRFGWRADVLLEKAAKTSMSAEVKIAARRLRAKLRDTPATVLTGHEEAVNAAVFSPDGRWLATAGADGLVVVWDAKSWDKAFVLQSP